MTAKRPAGPRIFKAAVPSGLDEMVERNFVNEQEMQQLVQANVGTLFPSLVFLVEQFGEGSSGRFRPDTIAFDTNLETFVVIEYKNRPNEGVINQAKAYLNYMKQNRFILETIYDKYGPGGRKRFEWKAMYAVVIAPGFDKFQIEGMKDDAEIELHSIRLYGSNLVSVERVGGRHESATSRRSPPEPKPPQPPTEPTSIPTLRPGMIRITEIVNPVENPPTELRFPDQAVMELNSWIDMLACTVKWLADNKILNEGHCPIQYASKTTLINVEPKHRSGIPFKNKKQVYGFFINSNLNQAGVKAFTIRLLYTLGLDPSEFYVRFGTEPLR